MKRIPRRIFTAEFKREGVQLATNKSLRTWIEQFERGELKVGLGVSKLTPEIFNGHYRKMTRNSLLQSRRFYFFIY